MPDWAIGLIVVLVGIAFFVWVFKTMREQEGAQLEESLQAHEVFAQRHNLAPMDKKAIDGIRQKLAPYAGLGQLDTAGGRKGAFTSSRGPVVEAVKQGNAAGRRVYLIEQRSIAAQSGGGRTYWSGVFVENGGGREDFMLLPRGLSTSQKPSGYEACSVPPTLAEHYVCYARSGTAPTAALQAWGSAAGASPPPAAHVRPDGVLAYYELQDERPKSEEDYEKLLRLAQALAEAR